MTEQQRTRKQEVWRAWYSKNKDTVKQKQKQSNKAKKSRLKKVYGLTLEAWEQLFDLQDRRCAICRTTSPSGKGSWHVDHCHDTDKVRGILCHNCNVGIGNLRDDILILEQAIRYLKENG